MSMNSSLNNDDQWSRKCDLPGIRIVLADDTENGTHDTRTIWHPGDLLNGYLLISSTVEPTSMAIQVFFKGTTRTWVVIDNSDISNVKTKGVTHEFLKQTQRLPYESGHNEKTETGQFVHKITFNFIIPMTLLPHDPAINEQHQCLPPSIKAGDSITDRAGRTYMQPLINYVIHAVVNFGGLVTGHLVKVQNTREIMLIPFTEIAPPLSTEDFPGEYTSISTQSLTKIPFGGLFGELSISMDEPPALRFSDSFPNASTLGYLTLVLRLVDVVANNIGPKRLTCTIRSGVLVKEAFSTMPLHGMPSYFMLNTEKCLRARSCYIALQTRKIDLHSWESKSHLRPGRNEESQDSTWVTTLILPICCSRRLLPTFCSALAALRYVLRVHLNIKDMYHSPLTLEVPLQVVYCRRVENIGAGSIVNDDHDQPNIHDFPGTLQLLGLDTFPPDYGYD